MTSRPSWDDTWLEVARVIAKRSKDKSTKLGCVIVGPDHEVRSVGYNCFPRGVDDNKEERQERPAKYFYFSHAERNAIFNAARMGTQLLGCVCYVSAHPCADCARAIIQSGIKEVVCQSDVVPSRFKENCEASAAMLREAGVFVRVANEVSHLQLQIRDSWG